MNDLVRATTLMKRPVMTLSGQEVGQVKDIIYGPTGGPLQGFTLAGRGLFAGPRGVALPMDAVRIVGPDAIMVESEDRLTPIDDVVDTAEARDRNVLNDKVVTDAGSELGTVSDVILRLDGAPEVVGYEIKASEAMRARGRRVLIPVPRNLAISGDAVIVPQRAADYATADLDGFDVAVNAFQRIEADGGEGKPEKSDGWGAR